MKTTVILPAPLRPLAGDERELTVKASTVDGALREIARAHPQLRHALLTESGGLRGFVNVFVNNDDIRTLDNLRTPLRGGDVVRILPSIAGG